MRLEFKKQEEDIEEKKKKRSRRQPRSRTLLWRPSRQLPAVFYCWTAMLLGRPDFAYRKINNSESVKYFFP